MRITFKLFATLSDYLPSASRSTNELALDVDEGTTIADIIARFHVPPKRAHLVLVNGVFVPPEARATYRLAPGDVLAIWPPIAGG
jgi:thiamine biosynthesis protein ThiS